MKKIFCFFMLCTMAAFAAASCEKAAGGEESPAKAVQMRLSLENAFSSEGSITSKAWDSRDKVGMYNMQSAANATISAPLTPGNFSSLFTFGLKNISNGVGLLGFFPSSANITHADGNINVQIAASQNGVINPVYVGKSEYNEGTVNMSLLPFYTVIYANVDRGNYSIVKAVLKGNANEKIAGNVKIKYNDLSAEGTESTITVTNSAGYDCKSKSALIPFMVAPVTFESGFTIICTTDSGEEIEIVNNNKVECTMGARIDAGTSSEEQKTQLLFCGDNMIYQIDADKAIANGYKNAIVWQWDAKKVASKMGMSESNMIRLDDCKLVDNHTKVLATSSKSYAVLLDYKTQELLWYSTGSKNAHSAELLPNNRVAVACSEGGDILQIFDIDKPNTELFSTPLEYAHGVVWNPANQRLYAGGNNTIKVYTLTDWETNAPKLTLEKTIGTYPSITGLHDMMLIDDNTLLVAGKYAAFYNISTGKFTNLPHFSASTGIKSVNYNPQTGECWYTDATDSDRELTWSSNDIRFTYDVTKRTIDTRIQIGDINMYKVRVYSW